MIHGYLEEKRSNTNLNILFTYLYYKYIFCNEDHHILYKMADSQAEVVDNMQLQKMFLNIEKGLYKGGYKMFQKRETARDIYKQIRDNFQIYVSLRIFVFEIEKDYFM